MKKILILDGISGVSLARDLTEAIDTEQYQVSYLNLAELEAVKFYKPRSALTKLLKKSTNKDSFYHYPKKKLSALKDKISFIQPDVVLVVGFIYRFINPASLQQLSSQYNFQLFLYDTDSCNLYSNRREFLYFLEYEMKVYERIFSFSRVVTDFLLRKGFDAVFAPFGSNLINVKQDSFQHDVLFVGSADLRRVFLLEHIVNNISIYGARWQRNKALMSSELWARVVDKPMWGEGLYQQLRAAKIVLNITRGPFYAAETGINLRIFEALAAGCFVLTDYCDEVVELFDDGVEIVTFKGSQELAEKVSFYLQHDDARLAIAKRGHQKFLQQFTWNKRVNDMLGEMNV